MNSELIHTLVLGITIAAVCYFVLMVLLTWYFSMPVIWTDREYYRQHGHNNYSIPDEAVAAKRGAKRVVAAVPPKEKLGGRVFEFNDEDEEKLPSNFTPAITPIEDVKDDLPF